MFACLTISVPLGSSRASVHLPGCPRLAHSSHHAGPGPAPLDPAHRLTAVPVHTHFHVPHVWHQGDGGRCGWCPGAPVAEV